MFCSKCGNQIAEGANFCSICGTPVGEAAIAVEPAAEVPEAPEIISEIEETHPAAPVFDEIQWNVNEYPSGSPGGKTEDIDFDWNADPKEIRDKYTRGFTTSEQAEINARADLNIEEVIPADQPKPEIEIEKVAPKFEDMSASDKIDKFYTFSSQNEEFQKLLNREYGKIKSGNPIQQEKIDADAVAVKKFEEREQDPSMEAFLEREGIVKPYEPKPFESDVLQRIEAQERAKEEAILEEQARQKALEEARLAAEAEMRAAEEARLAAEEKARLAAENEAHEKALEEARVRAAEEARARAAEEARLAVEEARRAEEEALIAAEREAKLRIEEENRKREEEKAALLRAEAEYRAQQEAAKIKEQQEARRAKLEEEKHMAEMERRRREETELKERLNREQESLAVQADSAATAEEVRRVLAQTARMREEEAAKIRAAVAGLKGEASGYEPAPAVQQPQPVTEVQPQPVAEVQPKSEPEVQPQPVPAVPVQPVEIEPETQGIEQANIRAHEETQNDLSDMAKARKEFLAEFGLDDEVKKKEEIPERKHTPVTMEELLGEKPVTGRNTMRSEAADMTATRVVDKAAVLAGLESTMRISKDELKKQEETKAAEIAEAVEIKEPETAEEPVQKPAPATVEQLLQQFEEQNSEEEPAEEPVREGFAPKEEPEIQPLAEAAEVNKPGLDNTMVMPENLAANAGGDFDSYGEKEAEEYRRRQEAESAMDSFYGEAAAEEAGRSDDISEKKADKKAEKKGGAGKVILKILLIILIIIFAVELAGIAIKFLAPGSGAAEFIDSQLNKVITLITG